MKTYHFTECPYPYLPEQYDSLRVKLPNRHYDPQIGAKLYHRYLDEWATADELGLDIMLNEHHQTASCIDSVMPLAAAVVARETKRARILLLGNPLANRREPVRVAEEMAFLDNLSYGRLEAGFVRGVPYEISATNSNPVAMAERMWEALDLIVKAWTSHDGPFYWEGKYFHHRNVNIWPRPYQQPHPPIWITALGPDNVGRVAERGYVVATFLTGFDGSKVIFDNYRKRRQEMGLEAPADRLAYAALIYTADTDELGVAGGKQLLWYLNSNKVPLQFSNPPGYHSVSSVVKLLRGEGPFASFGKEVHADDLMARGVLFAGNPDTVYDQIKRLYDHVGGFGHLLMMGQAGFLGHEDTVRSLELFAKEVYPRLREL
jgi:alkanesulfonate monooxygenase SsuD/methylene tetrahydromethanopterin reductase-like flavin-dependent oxidoreductase (luciferase family)